MSSDILTTNAGSPTCPICGFVPPMAIRLSGRWASYAKPSNSGWKPPRPPASRSPNRVIVPQSMRGDRSMTMPRHQNRLRHKPQAARSIPDRLANCGGGRKNRFPTSPQPATPPPRLDRRSALSNRGEPAPLWRFARHPPADVFHQLASREWLKSVAAGVVAPRKVDGITAPPP